MLREKVNGCKDIHILKGKGREKVWNSFFVHRTTELEHIWVKFMLQIKVDNKFYDDPWLIQRVSRHVFESIVKSELPLPTMSPTSVPTPSMDEKNAICYAAGYVLRSIRIKLSKLSKSSSLASKTIVKFINTLHEQDEDEQDEDLEGCEQESYKDWIMKVNRGGLFVVSDNVYETFLAIEIIERTYLKDINNPFNKAIDIDTLVQIVLADDDVQFWWSLVCATLENDLANVLLEKIARLWITLRGFSFSSAIVEQYKQSTKSSLKRKRSLRNDLKQKSSTTKSQ